VALKRRIYIYLKTTHNNVEMADTPNRNAKFAHRSDHMFTV
jgi:hypothetical protein